MEKAEDCKSIFIDQDKYRYKIVASVELIPRSEPEPEPHADLAPEKRTP